MTNKRNFLNVQHVAKDMVENVIKTQEHALIVKKIDIKSRIDNLLNKKITRLIGEFML